MMERERPEGEEQIPESWIGRAVVLETGRGNRGIAATLRQVSSQGVVVSFSYGEEEVESTFFYPWTSIYRMRSSAS